MLFDPKWSTPAEIKPLEPWRQLLLDAADLIERDGWWDGKPTPKGSFRKSHCIQTAVNSISITNSDFEPTLLAASNFLHHVGNPVFGIPSWNDAPGRTKEEVLAAMRGAARS